VGAIQRFDAAVAAKAPLELQTHRSQLKRLVLPENHIRA
jgi:hypothetical protein